MKYVQDLSRNLSCSVLQEYGVLMLFKGEGQIYFWSYFFKLGGAFFRVLYVLSDERDSSLLVWSKKFFFSALDLSKYALRNYLLVIFSLWSVHYREKKKSQVNKGFDSHAWGILNMNMKWTVIHFFVWSLYSLLLNACKIEPDII